jgi:rfaE bifunctional protein kinase chain/domain
MNRPRFRELTRKYRELRIAVVGDFCLDRYLEIDPAKQEISIETGLAVHNVLQVRSQPGAAGTVLNNLIALGIGTVFPVGFCGHDGEGMELEAALRKLPGVALDYFFGTPQRRTFTYTKPLVLRPGKPPHELNRLDMKNWTPTPTGVRRKVVEAVLALGSKVDAIIALDQVHLPETGVITREVLAALSALAQKRPGLPILADSRERLRDFPPLTLKMNRAELGRFFRGRRDQDIPGIQKTACRLAVRNRHPVFVTLAEQGMVGALPSGECAHAATFPLRGPIDIVGAGDSVTANLAAGLAAGANLPEVLELANAAASIVIHKLGTTGTASVREIRPFAAAGR